MVRLHVEHQLIADNVHVRGCPLIKLILTNWIRCACLVQLGVDGSLRCVCERTYGRDEPGDASPYLCEHLGSYARKSVKSTCAREVIGLALFSAASAASAAAWQPPSPQRSPARSQGLRGEALLIASLCVCKQLSHGGILVSKCHLVRGFGRR